MSTPELPHAVVAQRVGPTETPDTGHGRWGGRSRPPARPVRRTDVEIAAFDEHLVVIAGEEATPILDRLGRLLAGGRLDVTVDRTYTLEQAVEAHRAVMEENYVGKIVVVP